MSRSAGSRTALPPPYIRRDPEWKRKAGIWLHEANKGHIACIGRVTLRASSNFTTVTDMRAGPASFIEFTPVTPAAGAEHRNLVVSSRGKQFFIISHTNNAFTDRTYTYCILG